MSNKCDVRWEIKRINITLVYYKALQIKLYILSYLWRYHFHISFSFLIVAIFWVLFYNFSFFLCREDLFFVVSDFFSIFFYCFIAFFSFPGGRLIEVAFFDDHFPVSLNFFFFWSANIELFWCDLLFRFWLDYAMFFLVGFKVFGPFFE